MPRVTRGLQKNAPLNRPEYRLRTGADQIRLEALGQNSLGSGLALGTMADAERISVLTTAAYVGVTASDASLITGSINTIDTSGSYTTDSGGTQTSYIDSTPSTGIPEYSDLGDETGYVSLTPEEAAALNDPDAYDMPGGPTTPYVPPPPPPPPPVYVPPPRPPGTGIPEDTF